MNIQSNNPNAVTIIETATKEHDVDGTKLSLSERCYVPNSSTRLEAYLKLTGKPFIKSYW